jgi:hypothetical protein
MTGSHPLSIDRTKDPTLLDLFLVVQDLALNDDEAVAVVSSLLESGRIRLPGGLHRRDAGHRPERRAQPR